jgi:hypothetical protein
MEVEANRRHILSNTYTETGVGIARDGKGEVWYAQLFAAPR